MSNDSSELKDIEQKQPSNNNNIVIALVFILVGGVLLFSNLTGFSFDNWWALFMFIPAGFMAMNMRQDYQENGRLTSASTGSAIAGISMLTTATVFLFDLDWGAIWPIGFVIAGIGILLNGRSE